MKAELTDEELEELRVIFLDRFRVPLVDEDYILRFVVYAANEIIKRR